ncbi:MAG: glycosyltransferase family 4 protein [Nitrosopumilus sp.]
MNILLISPTQSGIGGIAQHVTGLTNYLKSKNHIVEIISSKNSFTIPVKGLKNPSFMLSSSLKAKFKKNSDIVHAHNIPSAKAMKNASGKKILSIHGIYSQQIENLHNKTISKIATNFEKDALSWADAITVVSKDAYEHYKKLGFNVYHIPNAIDINSLPQKSIRKYKKQIIFAGRLSPEKGMDVLLELAEILPLDIHLLILGSGPKDFMKNFSRSNIHYLGYVPKDETISLIRGSDILIQPSLFEGISSSILEAMACRVPVITTNVGGNKEIIEHNKTGILLETNSSEKLLEEILYLFANPTQKNNLIKNAFDVVKNFDWSNVGQLYENLYEDLVKS